MCWWEIATDDWQVCSLYLLMFRWYLVINVNYCFKAIAKYATYSLSTVFTRNGWVKLSRNFRLLYSCKLTVLTFPDYLLWKLMISVHVLRRAEMFSRCATSALKSEDEMEELGQDCCNTQHQHQHHKVPSVMLYCHTKHQQCGWWLCSPMNVI